MGIECEDILFRVEKHFGVRLAVDDFHEVWSANNHDCTAGMLHDIVCEKCRGNGIEPPVSSWTRIRFILAETLARPVVEIRRDAWLVRDLGCD